MQIAFSTFSNEEHQLTAAAAVKSETDKKKQ
jgi:hypothetical protein